MRFQRRHRIYKDDKNKGLKLVFEFPFLLLGFPNNDDNIVDWVWHKAQGIRIMNKT